MTDREEVLYELKHQVADAEWCDNEWKDNVPIWMLRGAFELLKAQEHVKPHYRELVILGQWDKLPFCGACGTSLGYSAQYCPNCGRPVEWEDDDGK